MRILITGSRGFIGASFGQFATAAGHEVLGISRSAQPASHWRGQHLQADAAQADLSAIIREFAPDLLLQAAGSASVSASISDPLADFRATAMTLANVLDGVRRSGCEPLVLFPSSAAVYGNPRTLPVAEDAPGAPISPYGFHKMACEVLAREHSECFGLSIVVCRLFSLFGPLQKRLLAWEIYHQLAGGSEAVELQGRGTETRDFIQIDDLSRAFLMLVPAVPRHACTFLNMASGREIPIMKLAETMRSLVAPHKEIICRGAVRPGDPHRWWADIRRLEALIPQWHPQSLPDGVAATLRAWQEQGD